MTVPFFPVRSLLAVVLSSLLVMPCGAQEATPKLLSIVIVEGDGVVNNVRQRVAREPIVQVEDENHKPVAGALLSFAAPNNGAGVVFSNGATSFTGVTGSDGRLVLRGVKPNAVKGQYQIRVSASFKGLTATNTITMTNAAVAAALSTTALWTVVLLAGAGAAAGIALGVNSGSGSSATATKPPVTITPGTPGVGAPR